MQTFIDKWFWFSANIHSCNRQTNPCMMRWNNWEHSNWRLNYKFTNKSSIQFYLLINENCITIIMYFKYSYIMWCVAVLAASIAGTGANTHLYCFCCFSSFVVLHFLFRLFYFNIIWINYDDRIGFLANYLPLPILFLFFYCCCYYYFHHERTDTRFLANVFQLYFAASMSVRIICKS